MSSCQYSVFNSAFKYFLFFIYFIVFSSSMAAAQTCDMPDPLDPYKILLTKTNDGLQIDTVGDDFCLSDPTPGCDFVNGNDLVKSNDLVCYTIDWNYNDFIAPAEDGINPTITIPIDVLGANWEPTPGCTVTGDGLTAPSVLTCTQPTVNSGFATSFPTCYTVHGNAQNGDSFNVTATISGEANGSNFENDSCPDENSVTVGPPRFNIEKKSAEFRSGTFMGLSGFFTRWIVVLEQLPGDAAGSGTLAQPITMTDTLAHFPSTSKLVGCNTDLNAAPLNLTSWPVGAPRSPFFPADPNSSVVDSGDVTCAQPTGDGGDIDISWDNIDLSGANIPTQYANNRAILPAGTRTYGTFIIEIFVPLDDDFPTDGALPLYNEIQDFAPVSPDGDLNYDGETEPGDDCDVSTEVILDDGGDIVTINQTESPLGDNCVGQTILLYSGSFSKFLLGWPRDHVPSTGAPVVPNFNSTAFNVVGTASGHHRGDGFVFPGQTFASRIAFTNNGIEPLHDASMCDVIDVNTLQSEDITPGGVVVPGDAVQVLGTCGSEGTDYVVEYASGYVDPAWTPAVGTAEGDRDFIECYDDSVDWKTTTQDPSFTPANPISKMRVRWLNPKTPGTCFAHWYMSARDTDLNGDLNPKNTILPNYMSSRFRNLPTTVFREFESNYHAGVYPGVDGTGRRGDRVMLSRGIVRVDKQNLPDDATVNHVAGDIVPWEIFPRYFTGADYATVAEVIVTDILPEGLNYIPGSSFFNGAQIVPVVTMNPDGSTTLEYNLGPQIPNQTFLGALPSITFETQIAITVGSGETLCNDVLISTEEDCSADSERDNSDCITISNSSGLTILKKVPSGCNFRDEDTSYSVEYVNLSTARDYTDTRVFDLFPHVGDGRVPATVIGNPGTFQLSSATASDAGVVFYYTNSAPSNFPITFDARTAVLTPPTWCTLADITAGVAGCPASLGDATALIAENPLVPARASGALAVLHSIDLTFSTLGNVGGDVYTNQASAGTPDLALTVTSNQVTQEVCDANIGNYVWIDKNADGIQGAAELGLNGVVVALFNVDGTPALDQSGNPVQTLTTNDATGNPGFYLLERLLEGTYYVEFTLPSGYTWTTQMIGSATAATDSDPDVVTGQTADFGIMFNDMLRDIDAGVFIPVMLGDRVWEDLNGDGIQDPGEPALAGVVINLLDASGSPVLDDAGVAITTVTDLGGLWMLTVPPGDYIVEFVAPASFVFSPQFAGASDMDSNANPATGRTPLMTLCSGDKDMDIDAGMNRLASLGDFVFIDTDGDGIQDPGEPGLNGIVVNLLDASGSPILDAAGMPITTITSNGGAYTFAGLPPGTYKVEFILPTGYVFTPPNAGGDDALDSDADVVTGMTATTTLISGQNDPTLDAGVQFNGSIGDQVWIDKNKDGIHDPTEAGIPGVIVQLLDASGVPVLGQNGAPLISTTDAGGFYGFPSLGPGSYKLQFSLPSGYIFTNKDGAPEDLDSDVDPANGMTDVFTLALGEMNPNWDAGLRPDIEISGTAWIDQDEDGVIDAEEGPLVGTTVSLMDENCNPILDINGLPITTTVDPNGNYVFDCLEPGTYSVQFTQPPGYNNTVAGPDNDAPSGKTPPFDVLDDTGGIDSGYQYENVLGNIVWNDADGDGVLDPDEEGVDGIIVSLLDCNGNPVLDLDGNPITTVTGTGPSGESGFYEFTNLTPGCYRLTFTDPEGMAVFVPPGQGGDPATDSDFDPDTGQTGDLIIDIATRLDEIDAGIFGAICGECNTSVLESPAILSWNGFLEQINIVTVYNTCSVAEAATLSLYDQLGVVQDTIPITLNPKQQIDIVLNNVNGFSPDSYGYVEVSFASTDCVNGHLAFYKPNSFGNLEFSDFTTILPFVNSTTGNSYAIFNTVNASTDLADLGALVANWIQITNLDATTSKSFTKNIYDNTGVLLETELVTVPAFGRVDLQAGHLVPGPDAFGLVEVVPSDTAAEYSAQLFRYGATASGSPDTTTFDFANGAHTKDPEIGCQSVQISSGGNADNWLEVANVNAASLAVDIYINTLGVINSAPTMTVNLAGFAQEHLYMNSFLPAGASGIVTACPQDPTQALLLESMFYFRDGSGTVSAAYGVQGADGYCMSAFVSYNTFLSQSSFMRLGTAGECVIDMSMKAYDQDGSLIGELPQGWILPTEPFEFDLISSGLGILPNSYGLIEIEINSTTPGALVGQTIQVQPGGIVGMNTASANSFN